MWLNIFSPPCLSALPPVFAHNLPRLDVFCSLSGLGSLTGMARLFCSSSRFLSFPTDVSPLPLVLFFPFPFPFSVHADKASSSVLILFSPNCPPSTLFFFSRPRFLLWLSRTSHAFLATDVPALFYFSRFPCLSHSYSRPRRQLIRLIPFFCLFTFFKPKRPSSLSL